jgi:hypothetical protein
MTRSASYTTLTDATQLTWRIADTGVWTSPRVTPKRMTIRSTHMHNFISKGAVNTSLLGSAQGPWVEDLQSQRDPRGNEKLESPQPAWRVAVSDPNQASVTSWFEGFLRERFRLSRLADFRKDCRFVRYRLDEPEIGQPARRTAEAANQASRLFADRFAPEDAGYVVGLSWTGG